MFLTQNLEHTRLLDLNVGFYKSHLHWNFTKAQLGKGKLMKIIISPIIMEMKLVCVHNLVTVDWKMEVILVL